MASNYRYVLDCLVAERLLSLPTKQRDQAVIIFRNLADNPFQYGSSTFQDSSDREIQEQQFGQWLIAYWPDHAVKEVRVVGIRRVRQ